MDFKIKHFGSESCYDRPAISKESTENCIVISDQDCDTVSIWGREEIESLIKTLTEILDEGWIE